MTLIFRYTHSGIVAGAGCDRGGAITDKAISHNILRNTSGLHIRYAKRISPRYDACLKKVGNFLFERNRRDYPTRKKFTGFLRLFPRTCVFTLVYPTGVQPELIFSLNSAWWTRFLGASNLPKKTSTIRILSG